MIIPLHGKQIHIWVPGTNPGSGGIQTFSFNIAKAIAELYPDYLVRIISKHDVLCPKQFEKTGNISFSGAGRFFRKFHFVSLLLWHSLLGRPKLIVSTHVNFTPLANRFKRWLGIKYCVIAHGIDVWGVTRRSLITGIKEAESIFAVSRFTRDVMMRELGLTGDQIKLLPNSIDGETFSPGPKSEALLSKFGLNSGHKILLTVGRLDPEELYKGYDLILKLMPALKLRVPGLQYLLAGKGADVHRIKGLIDDLGVSDCVTLTGFVTDEELPDLYRLCDVFAMPSRKEGFGIVFLEALASGKPVIAGNLDGSVDPLADGELGVLVDPLDQTELFEKLVQLLTGTHPLAILKQPEALRAGALRRFGYPAFTRRVKELLDPELRHVA